MRNKTPRILVAMILSEPAGQRKLAGIFSHSGSSHKWDITILSTQDEVREALINQNFADKYDGIIYSARYDKRIFERLATIKCPAVVMENDTSELSAKKDNLVIIRNDANAIAKAAMHHFSEMGRFQSFAFVDAPTRREWGMRREVAFRHELAKNGISDLHTYRPFHTDSEDDLSSLRSFLLSLERPAAVLAVHDVRAVDVVTAATKAGLKIPDNLAILGVDNDPYFCHSVSPAISSIEPDHQAEGLIAASTLDRMLKSSTPRPTKRMFVGVKRVETRETTKHLPPAAVLIARAKDYIAKHATDGIAPTDIAASIGVSYSLLKLRFRETQKATIGQLITATKLGEVARRLRETKQSISSIQELCGFKNANALKNLFKSRFGVSMRDYRAQHKES